MTNPTCDEYTRLFDDEEPDEVVLQMSSSASTLLTQLQWRPFLVLLVLNTMQPLAFEIVFPFVNQMILEIGVVTDPERVGFYSGLIESIFSCLSLVTILPLSAIADKIGRKPVILWGMIGLAASVVSFGMSKSFLAMVLSRCLGGALGGSWACIRTMIGEMTDKSNQSMALSASSIAYRVGQIVGLPLGGLLAHPERHFPLVNNPFWYEYPFALPCFVAAALCMCSVALGYWLLPETLQSTKKRLKKRTMYAANASATDADVSAQPQTDTPETEDELLESTTNHTYRSIITPSIISLLCSSFAMSFASEMLFSVFPLFAFTPVSLGGLGMNESSIGTQLGIRAALSIFILGFYSSLQGRVGAVRVYQFAMWMWPLTTLFFPFLNFLARQGKSDEWPFIVGFCVYIIAWSIAGFGWASMAVMVTDAEPSGAALATMNGLSQMTLVFPQAIAPALATSSFAASIKSDIAGGNLIWIVLFVMTTVAAMHSLTLRGSVDYCRQ